MEVETVFILSLPNQYVDPSEWSREIGLTPLNICSKGEKVSPHPRARISPNSYWVFGVERRSEQSVEAQLHLVFEQVYEKKNKILNLVKKLNLKVKCDVSVWVDNLNDLSVLLDNDLLRKMTELEVSFTFSRY